jgi:hypothetical protein
MGFEGLFYYGAAGSTASTQITNSRDITESFATDKGSTTIRGDGSAAPLKTSRVTGRDYNLKWQSVYKSDDTTLLALIAAAVAGTPVALRTKSYSSGLGVDADFILEFENGKPLAGEQTLDFTATLNDDNRAPQLNV